MNATKYYHDDASGITIYHGDCREVLPMVGGGIDCFCTSPPYNQLGSRMPSKPSGMHAETKWISNTRKVGYADDMDEAAYAVFMHDVFAAAAAAAVDGASLFFNHKCRWRDTVLHHPIDIVRGFSDWTLRQELIWNRSGSTTLNARMFAPNDERIFWLIKGHKWKWNQLAASFLSIWKINQDCSADGHPCPFPIDIPMRCIAATTDETSIVCDPFMGSGTTLEAAKLQGRRAIGIEIVERYCEIAARRLSQEVLFGLRAQQECRLK